jgi:ATP-dependent DNA helicase RecG
MDRVSCRISFRGGRILIGVDDDGTVSGVQRPEIEEGVMNVIAEKVNPSMRL